ncbi:uncharacterized protein B0P05DRAFT_576982 [Gilbertella persicaria]|uniref:uncharacterized protein n=1 Tax=Gilbertella persicaria TaxID=101096 RepID=UPI0022206490|nr:uncharacterized protein B0P05DRAFT_576982 [Gilbertella persicaria]KAI8094935.1 hypothetical protein B0P05DRAFT_576982 [Gilbertella persicaria]
MAFVLYTIHKFVAENVDEISINVGEKVVILEKDEGYNDGWFQGRNERGEIGLFPITYTAKHPPIHANHDIETRIGSLEDTISKMKLPQDPPASFIDTKPVEEWTSEQVAIWLTSLGFDNTLADNFRDQEISGDILLELTLDSLKELQITTFGKRFKVHNAINALRQKKQKHSNDTHPMEAQVASPFPEINSKNSVYKQQAYPDDDVVSNYSTVIRNSQLNDKTHEQSSFTPSILSTRASVDTPRYPTKLPQDRFQYLQQQQQQRPTSHQLPSAPLTESTSSEWKRNTMNNLQENSLLPTGNKLHSILPHNTIRRSEDILSDGSAQPDMEGWLYKQGDKYKTWNKRWFVLKGSNLFYFKSPKAVRMKGIINLKGYRIEVDETIHPGKYCFLAHHERERTFFFYTEHEKHMKEWLKALMKATIARDYTTPVMSSSTVPTVSLEMARKMRPRPPSTIFSNAKEGSRASTPHLFSVDEHPQPIMPYQPAHRIPSSMSLRAPPEQKHTSDYAIDQRNRLKDSGFNSTHHVSGGLARSVTQSSHSSSGRQSVSTLSMHRPYPYRNSLETNTATFYPDEEDEDLIDPENMSVMESHRPPEDSEEEDVIDRAMLKQDSYIQWVNSHLQNKHIKALSELSGGDVLIDFLSSLSRKEIVKPMPYPTQHAQRMDRIIIAFKFMTLEGIDLNGVCSIRGKAIEGHWLFNSYVYRCLEWQ